MRIREDVLLKKVFWPTPKNSVSGNLIYNATSEDFMNTHEISVSRTNDKFEIFFTTSPTFKPNERSYFVKMFFERIGEEFELNRKLTSPELVKEQDITDTLDSIQSNIIKMDIKPQFFSTGLINRHDNKTNLNSNK